MRSLEVNLEGIRNVPELREIQGTATHVASFDITKLPGGQLSLPTTDNARTCLSQHLAQMRGFPQKRESLRGESRKKIEIFAGQSVTREHTVPRANQVWNQVDCCLFNMAKLFRSCLLPEMSPVPWIGPIPCGPRTVYVGFCLALDVDFLLWSYSFDIYCFH